MGRARAWLIDLRWFKAYPLAGHISIGRGQECTVILRDAEVSRLHATVIERDGVFVLQPSGASGTFVNGAPVIGDRELQEGDVVEIAFSRFRFTTQVPTSEMSVIERDAPTLAAAGDGPTSASMRAANVALARLSGLSRKRWHLAAIIVLLIALILLLQG